MSTPFARQFHKPRSVDTLIIDERRVGWESGRNQSALMLELCGSDPVLSNLPVAKFVELAAGRMRAMRPGGAS